MKVIEITVSKGGQSRVETKGFTGSECQLASRFIEQAIGSREEVLSKVVFLSE